MGTYLGRSPFAGRILSGGARAAATHSHEDLGLNCPVVRPPLGSQSMVELANFSVAVVMVKNLLSDNRLSRVDGGIKFRNFSISLQSV